MTDAMLPTPTVQDAANTAGPSQADRNTPPLNSVAVALMPTPKASDGPHGGPGMRNGRGGADALPGIVHLLPTPAVNDMGAGKTPPQWDEWTDRMRTEHGNGNGHGKSLSIEAQRLLPTATAQDAASSSGSNPDWGHGVTLTDAARSMGPLMVAATYSGDFRQTRTLSHRAGPGRTPATVTSVRRMDDGPPRRVGHRHRHPPKRPTEGTRQRGSAAASRPRAADALGR